MFQRRLFIINELKKIKQQQKPCEGNSEGYLAFKKRLKLYATELATGGIYNEKTYGRIQR